MVLDEPLKWIKWFMEKHEVTSSRYPWNMAGWCSEKSGNVVRDLARLVDYFKRLERPEQDSDVVVEMAHSRLHTAVWDATKMFAFSCGAEWSGEDQRAVMERGERGYIELSIKYGQMTETATSFAEIDDDIALKGLIEELEKLLHSELRSTRTLIHDVLRKSLSRREEIEEIRQLTDKVSMGELSWNDYRIEVSAHLEDLKSELLDEN